MHERSAHNHIARAAASKGVEATRAARSGRASFRSARVAKSAEQAGARAAEAPAVDVEAEAVAASPGDAKTAEICLSTGPRRFAARLPATPAPAQSG